MGIPKKHSENNPRAQMTFLKVAAIPTEIEKCSAKQPKYRSRVNNEWRNGQVRTKQ